MDAPESSPERRELPGSVASLEPQPSIGIALSGGGHRAALFSLGALLYLAHAKEADGRTASNDVKLITSVSGSSITNAFLAQTLDFPTASAQEVTAAAARLASQIALRGTLFVAWETWALVLVLMTCLSPAVLAMAAWLTERATSLGMLAAALGILAAGIVLQARGLVFERALRGVLLSQLGGRATTLADMDRRPSASREDELTSLSGDRGFRQVLCGTEIQTGHPIYFSRSGIDCAPFDVPSRPDQVALAAAVQASAALPVAFPPRTFPARFARTFPARFFGTASWRGRKPKRVVVADGGVRDNLGVELFVMQHGIPPPQWRPLITRTIVIGAAANRLGQGHLRRSVPYLGELASLWRVANFPYDTRERVHPRPPPRARARAGAPPSRSRAP